MQVKIFCTMLCLALVCVIHAQAQDEVENLANNWDFEEGIFVPWRLILKPNAGGDGLLLIDEDEFFTGEASLNIKINNGGNHERGVHVIQQPMMGPIKKGRKYTFATWIKADEERTLFMRFMKSGGGDATVPVRQQFTVNEEWNEYWFTVEAQQDTDFRVEFEVGLSDADLWLDHIRVHEGEYIGEGLGQPKAVTKSDNMLTTCWGRLKAQR